MKSTVIVNRFTLLFINILLDHFIGDITGADSQIATSPEMPAPKHFAKMRKFGKKNTRAYAFQPLHDLADILGRSIADKHVNMIARYLPGDYLQFMFHRYLAQNISGSYSNLARQNPFPVFRNPDEMNFQIRLGVSSQSITSHSDTV